MSEQTTAERILPDLLAASDDPITDGPPGMSYGSPRRERQQRIIDAAGGEHKSHRGYVFPDGSAITWEPDPELPGRSAPVAKDAAWVAGRESGVRPNGIGLTRYQYRDDLSQTRPGEPLWFADKLDAEGIAYERTPLPRIVGMAGSAYLLTYDSPRGMPVTVLVIPHQGIDSFAEEYYTFEGMGCDQAAARDWLAVYDQLDDLRLR